MHRGPLLLLAFLLALPSLAIASPQGVVERAQRDFDEGRYEQVLSVLAGITDDDPQVEEARFLQAYAHFKLGHLDQAEQLLDELLARRFTARCGLLHGMLAFKRRNFRVALARLEAVQETGEQPWATTAAGLLERVREEGVEAEQEFSDAIARAKQAIEAGRFAAALRHLETADRAIPKQHLPLYYRGLIAFKRKRLDEAERLLLDALAIEPADGWSQYMLALTVAASGRGKRARPVLTQLARGAKDPELKKVAREALARLDRPRPSPRPQSRLLAGLELGSGLDTNPYYVDEVAAPLADAALAVQVGGRLAYLRALSKGLRLDVGLRGLERAYAVGGQGVEQTEVAAWAGMLFDLGRGEGGVHFNYALLLYGHEPLFSNYTASAQAGYPLLPWLRALAAGRVSWRAVLDVDRRYLEALQAGGLAGLRLSWRRLVLEVLYEVYREWAEPVPSAFSVTENKGPGPGAQQVVVYELSADYSQLGHGPLLWAKLTLPWRLTLTAGAGLQQRLFDAGDTLSWDVSGAEQRKDLDPRRDLRVFVNAELSRQLPLGFQVALAFESLDNLSSLAIVDPVSIDRSFSRRQVMLLARWGWPAED